MYCRSGSKWRGIFIDPKRNLVIASNSNWPRAIDPNTVGAQREAFYKAVQAAVDAEAMPRAK
jgi:CubicO group peptidase (beta-lactamase class C family)